MGLASWQQIHVGNRRDGSGHGGVAFDLNPVILGSREG